MDVPLLVTAVLLGIVEGVTEFLPVSSTGHLIVAGELLGFRGERAATFEIFIQLGAILAVVWDRRAMLVPGERFSPRAMALAMVAFLPAALVGLATHHAIKQHLFSTTVVAWGLIAGAAGIWAVERARPAARVATLDGLGLRHALGVGAWQCLALVPGVSRAAATILGGMVLGLGRPVATEFSFLLAIPTVGAAAIYDLVDSRAALRADDAPAFALGLVVSFAVALVVVRWLLGYVRRHDFRPFAAWRLALGLAILAFL